MGLETLTSIEDDLCLMLVLVYLFDVSFCSNRLDMLSGLSMRYLDFTLVVILCIYPLFFCLFIF